MKKYLPYILITAFGLVIFLAPHISHAWLDIPSFEGLVAKIGNMILSACIYLLSLCAKLFDAVVAEAISAPGHTSYIAASGVVQTGWQVSRDLANIFFIFIIIFIGMATIVQLPGYNYKELLVKVIVVAVMINFSLFFTQTIIKSSDVLALQFYNKIHSDEVDLSTAFAGGLKIQTLYNPKGTGLVEQANKLSDKLTLKTIFIITAFGSALTLISAFVLLAGAIMFLIRTVALSVLTILAPLAFIGMILPKNKFVSQWGSQLINQAFFAPAFLFMFYLTVLTINKAKLGDVYHTYSIGLAQTIANPASGGSIKLAVQFITLIILMLGCLSVAKFMGGQAGEYGLSGAHWIKDKTLRFAAKKTIAPVGEKISESKWLQRQVAKHPHIAGWTMDKAKQLAGIGGRKEEIDKLVKRGMTLEPKERAKYLEKLGQGFFADKQAQKEMFKQMSARERAQLIEKSPSFKPIYDNLLKTLKIEEREKTEKIEKERAVMQKIERLGSEKKPLTESETEELLKTIQGDQIKDIAKKGGAAADEFFAKLKTFGSTVDEVSDKLASMGNKGLAVWMQGTAAKGWLKVYGIKEAKEGEKPKIAGPGEFKQARQEAEKRGEKFG